MNFSLCILYFIKTRIIHIERVIYSKAFQLFLYPFNNYLWNTYNKPINFIALGNNYKYWFCQFLFCDLSKQVLWPLPSIKTSRLCLMSSRVFSCFKMIYVVIWSTISNGSFVIPFISNRPKMSLFTTTKTFCSLQFFKEKRETVISSIVTLISKNWPSRHGSSKIIVPRNNVFKKCYSFLFV